MTIIPVNGAGLQEGEWRIFHYEDGIYWGVDNGATVVNLSLGGYRAEPYASEISAANYVASHGVLVCAAAGNANNEGTAEGGVPRIADNHYPSAISTYMSVAAVDDDDIRVRKPKWWWGSNYGSTVDICAPGQGDVGAHSDSILTLGNSNNSEYINTFNGTSAATPHVAGLAALLKYVNNALTAAQIRNTIETTAIDQVGDPAEDTPGWDQYHGHGLIDAAAAVSAVVPPPPTPTPTNTPTPSYSIDGYVTGPEGIVNPISGVTVEVSGHGSVSTDSSGHYRMEGLPPGTYTVTPSKQDYTFQPANRTVTLEPDAEQVNFVGTPVQTYSISGYVTGPEGIVNPIPGVTVCTSGHGCVTTDGSGHYRMEGLPGGTYTVTPSKEGYTFIPASKGVSLPLDAEQVNFVGVPSGQTYFISGFVTGPEGIVNPISGVTVCISEHGCVTTDDSGQYRKEGLPPGTHTVIPSKSGYSFTPPDKQVTLPPDAEQVNFTGTPVDCCYHIAGYVTGPEGGANPFPGIRVDIRGQGSSFTDHNGRYIIAGLEANRYKVLPYDDRYDFGPVCKWVIVPPNREDVNFVAVPTSPHSGVTLYEHDQYLGVHETYTGDNPDLTDSCIGDNIVTSLKIRGPYSAILYQEPNYQGTSETLTDDDPQLGDNIIGNDTVSSICVLFADFDGNGRVDVVDIMEVASRWRITDDDPDWNARYDLNGDGIISVVDIMLVAAHWGERCE